MRSLKFFNSLRLIPFEVATSAMTASTERPPLRTVIPAEKIASLQVRAIGRRLLPFLPSLRRSHSGIFPQLERQPLLAHELRLRWPAFADQCSSPIDHCIER